MEGIDLFREYVLMRDRKFLHYDENKRGFIIYSFPANDDCFLDEVFVLEDHRELSVIMEMIRFVEHEARKRGCKFLTAAVNIRKDDPERILRGHFWNKMKIVGTSGDFIYTRKGL